MADIRSGQLGAARARRRLGPGPFPVLLYLAIAAGTGRADPPLGLDLGQSVELALQHNHEVRTSEEEVAASEARIREARAAAFPDLDVSAAYNHTWIQSEAIITVSGEDADGNPVEQTQRVTFGQPNYLSTGISLQQTLYAGGKVRHGLRAAEVYADQSRARTRATRHAITYQVQRAFLAAAMARQGIGVTELALEQARRHRDQVAQRLAGGSASEFDLLRADVEVANREPPLIAARNGYARATERLKAAIGLDMAQPVEIDADLESVVASLRSATVPLLSSARSGAADSLDYDVDALTRRAIQSRPEVRALDLQDGLLREQLAIERGDRRPTLALVSQYLWEWQLPNQLRARDEDVTDSWTTGLALSLPLYDGGRTRARVAQTRVARRQVEIARSRLEDRIGLEVRSALLDLQEAVQKIRARDRTVAQAERGLAIAEVRFAGGMATQVEVLDAQLALTASRTHKVQATHDYAVALATIAYATGPTIPAAQLGETRRSR